MKKHLLFAGFLAIAGTMQSQSAWTGTSTTGNAYRTGNVGVGTTSPVNKIDVGVTTADDGLRITQSTNGSAAIILNNTTTSGKVWSLNSLGQGNNHGAGNFSIYDAANSRFFISGSTGYVGIGTTTPSQKLDVAGAINTTGNVIINSRIYFNSDGTAKNINWSGTGSRIIMADAGGGLAPLLQGTASQVLYGNGVWASLPEGATMWTNNAGSASTSLGLKVAGLAGTGDNIVYADANGNLKIAPNVAPGGVTGPCAVGAKPWYVGGNNTNGAADIGTCDKYNFILKSFNIPRQWIMTDGSISFGANMPSTTGGPEYNFNKGIVRLSGPNSFGGAGLIFDSGTNPYGDWGLEYNPSGLAKPGLNFWKPYASPYSNNDILFLADDGTIGMGTDNPTSRLTMDAWSGDGLRIIGSNNNSKVFALVNNNTTTSPKEFFNVYNNGYTEIKVYSPLGMPKPYGATTERAFTIRDASSNNKDLFVVTAQGKVYAREVEINLTATFPDYVFAKDYKLKSISEVSEFISKNKHLPGFEKGEHYEKNGINVTDMLIKQQEKMEEMMLYIIELEKRLKTIEKKK